LVFPLGASEVYLGLNGDQLKSLLLIVLTTGALPMLIYYYELNKTEAKRVTITEIACPI
jgi:hypothetical protein